MVRRIDGFKPGRGREYNYAKPTGDDARLSLWLADFHCASLYGAFQRLVKRGFGFLVFLLGDSALFVFDFELEDLFFQGFQKQGGAICGLGSASGWNIG